MATKSKGKVIPINPTQHAVVPWDEEMEPYGKQAQAMVASVQSGRYLSTRTGIISFQGQQIGNTVDIIVLDSVLENSYYEDRFEAGNIKAPVCFAMARHAQDMKPFEGCDKPQNTQCRGCNWNEFGTADTGRGKACKNAARIALFPVTEDMDAASIAKSQIYYLRTTVTSTRDWWSYFNADIISQKGRSNVITRVTLTPDARNQFSMGFETVDQLPPDVIRAVRSRLVEAEQDIMHTLGNNTKEEEQPKRAPEKRAYAGAVKQKARK